MRTKIKLVLDNIIANRSALYQPFLVLRNQMQNTLFASYYSF
jgi:hypothetical protein